MTDPTPISDEELDTLEQQAKVDIAAGWVGINPHKVLGMVASLRRLRAVEKELREALHKISSEDYDDIEGSFTRSASEIARAALARETEAKHAK